jgi:HAD superfamily hydrolase (TIGR01509 family)
VQHALQQSRAKRDLFWSAIAWKQSAGQQGLRCCDMKQAIIFDFDGVIADSEVLSNMVLAECVSEAGLPTTLDDAYRLYMGKRVPEIAAAVETQLGRALRANFAANFQMRALARFQRDLQAVTGARDYLAAFSQLRRGIASTSSPERLAVCLDVLGLKEVFGTDVYSSELVARGKPHPDIFLHAAKAMDVEPRNCLVIEDSASGVQAGVAAGMTVIGLLAASHIRDGHRDRLSVAGAHFIAATFDEAAEITRGLVRP